MQNINPIMYQSNSLINVPQVLMSLEDIIIVLDSNPTMSNGYMNAKFELVEPKRLVSLREMILL